MRDEDYTDAPVLAPEPSGSSASQFPAAPRVLMEIPADVQSLKESDRDRVVAWRHFTRAALPWYLDRGYGVEGLLAAPDDDRYRYALRASRNGSDGSGT
jgi:predicted GNAT superfamily acetyltransferase